MNIPSPLPINFPTHQPAAMDTAAKVLLSPNGLDERLLQLTLDNVMGGGADYADLYFQMSRGEHWGLEEGLVKNGSFSIEGGVGIRTLAGEQAALAYTDELSAAAIHAAAQKLLAMNRQGQSGRTPLTPSTAAHPFYSSLDPSAGLSSDDKVALLKWVDEQARAAGPEIIQVMTSMAASYDVILIANSEGELVADVRPLVRFNITVIAEKDGRRETGHAGGGGRYGLAELTRTRLSQWISDAVAQARTNLQSRPAPAGEMTVVLGAGWPGVLLHEAVGHGLEGDFTRKGSSVFAGKIGQQVAAKGVTVVDDGTLPHRRGSLSVDDEGSPTQRNVLIEDGKVRGFMQDRLNAHLAGVARTGNGRRESFAHLPMPRMTNTYMLGGQYSHEEIIASVPNGIYCPSFAGGQVDITNGKFVFSASEAWKIENGRLTYPLKGATLIGNGPESLTRITMIGNDMTLDSGIGNCGKDGQSVPVGVGQPTLKLEKMTVGGTEEMGG